MNESRRILKRRPGALSSARGKRRTIAASGGTAAWSGQSLSLTTSASECGTAPDRGRPAQHPIGSRRASPKEITRIV